MYVMCATIYHGNTMLVGVRYVRPVIPCTRSLLSLSVYWPTKHTASNKRVYNNRSKNQCKYIGRTLHSQHPPTQEHGAACQHNGNLPKRHGHGEAKPPQQWVHPASGLGGGRRRRRRFGTDRRGEPALKKPRRAAGGAPFKASTRPTLQRTMAPKNSISWTACLCRTAPTCGHFPVLAGSDHGHG
jgi:hypothetical protein